MHFYDWFDNEQSKDYFLKAYKVNQGKKEQIMSVTVSVIKSEWAGRNTYFEILRQFVAGGRVLLWYICSAEKLVIFQLVFICLNFLNELRISEYKVIWTKSLYRDLHDVVLIIVTKFSEGFWLKASRAPSTIYQDSMVSFLLNLNHGAFIMFFKRNHRSKNFFYITLSSKIYG